MRDSELVASIMAGAPDGLAHAYDRYAESLYKYCQSMLNDPADAADAVQDTFVVAGSRLDSLRDPDLLRPWLYAVVRNECLRMPRVRKTTSALGQVPGVTDEGADVSEDAEHAELRALLRRAIGGLNPGEREAIQLQLEHGLETAEVASVLGVSRNHAHSLLSHARDQLEACLGVPLAEMAAVAAESFRLAEGPPAGLKGHVLRMATGQDPSAVAHRATVLGRARSFGRHGFPKPVRARLAHPSGAAGLRGLHQSRQGKVAVAAVIALAVVIAVTAFALTGNSKHTTLAEEKPTHSPNTPALASSAPAPSRGAGRKPTTAPARRVAPHPVATTALATTAAPAPSPTSPTLPSQAPAPGTLTADPDGGLLVVPPDGTPIALTAEGGPVSWSIDISGGIGSVHATPSSGTLAAGQSVTVMITASQPSGGQRLTVNPGGPAFAVVSGRDRPG
jgi:RNA polymerase sigma factor (sigma-70 family)